jgi:two-component system sensor histidine kinase TctE
MSKPNLRRQVSLWLLLPLVALLGLDAYLTYQRAMSAANLAFDRSLQFSIRSIRVGTSLRNGVIHVELPYLALEMFESGTGSKMYYLIREQSGLAITGYADLPLPPERATLGMYETQFYNAQFRNQSLRMGVLRLPIRDVPMAQTRVVWIMVGETIEPRQAVAQQILYGSLWQEGLLIVLALGIVWMGVGRGLRPLNRLSAKVATRLDDDPTPLDKAGLPSEVEPLVESINVYIARLRRMQESRRRFFTDAAHQLKTPLTVIQAECELALRETADDRVRLRLTRLNGAVRQAGKSVHQLLSLARLDADSGYRAQHVPLRLDKLARSVTLDWSPVARSRQIDLGFEHDGCVGVLGQRELLAELCGNLIDNAIRYGGDGCVITVRVAQHEEGALLQVIDNGPGIPLQERDAVFERFYRAVSTQAAEGSGLGLSIVQEIARVHRAQVVLSDAPGGGLIVDVLFCGAASR